MKKTTIVLFALLSFGLLLPAYGQWRTYGVDDRVNVKVQQQPTVIDTLGQRILFSDCQYGRVAVQVIADRQDIENKEQVQRYYDNFLIGFAEKGNLEILSKKYDTLKHYHSITFTTRFKDSNLLGIGKLVWMNNNTYLFQYLYDESNHVDALEEATTFFYTIRFIDIGADQFSMNKVYGMVGLLLIFIVGSTILGIIILIVYLLNRRFRQV